MKKNCKIQAQNAYSNRMSDGKFYGTIGLRDIRRFESTQKHLLNDFNSILDVGCFCGEWLHFLSKKQHIGNCVGVDVSSEKIQQAKINNPELNFMTGYAEDLNIPEKEFDVVTCLEVLEHIPEWNHVFKSLFKYARKQVLITVPNREKVQWHVCIHCGQKTPVWGHVNSFSEDDFPDISGWSRSCSRIKDKGPFPAFSTKIKRLIKPIYPWLLISYIKN